MSLRLIGLFERILRLLREPEPASPVKAAWDEAFVFEYAMGRYQEIDGLISRTRQSGQTLLTWETALFVGTLGISAKGGLLQFTKQDTIVEILVAIALVTMSAAIVLSARAAFWTEPSDTPTSPVNLLKDLCESSIDKRALCESLANVYVSSKTFLARVQRILRRALLLTAVGIVSIALTLILLSMRHIEVIERMFSGGK